LVFLQKSQETSVLILKCVDESNTKFQAKEVESWPICISNIINKFLYVLMDKLPTHLPPFPNVNHKIEVDACPNSF
jgi:hypothetical protein